MEGIYIKTDMLPKWLDRKYFMGTDMASIEDLIAILEDLEADKERLEEELDDLRQDMRDNYKFIDTREAVVYSENW